MTELPSTEGPLNPEFEALDPEETRPVDASDVPAGMTVAQTDDWVSGDKVRAAAALEVENAKDDPRATLVQSLERLVNDETGGMAQGQPVSRAVTPGAEGTV